jgi:hypothetical protein
MRFLEHDERSDEIEKKISSSVIRSAEKPMRCSEMKKKNNDLI